MRTHLQGLSSAQTITLAYDGLGAVVAQEQARDVGSVATAEEFRPDPFGNVLWRRATATGVSVDDAPRQTTYGVSGALEQRTSLMPVSPTAHEYEETFDQGTPGVDGRVERTEQLLRRAAAAGGEYKSQMAARNYYDGSNRLAALERYVVQFDPDDTTAAPVFAGTWETYRYDALGRRVYVRAQPNAPRPDSTAGVDALCSAPSPCGAYTETAVWDGNALVYEHRTAESTANAFNSGSVGYLHVGDLDQPLAVIHNDSATVVNYDWRGLAVSGVNVAGAAEACLVGSCTNLPTWAGQSQAGVYFDPGPSGGIPTGTPTWMGTLLANGGGGGGLLYRRNRYYDPNTGQFTQEDPIGFGGGLNLYGFAAGDPVNAGDPFGLTPDCTTLPCPLILGGAAALGGPLTIFGAAVLAVFVTEEALGSSGGGISAVDRAMPADATAYRPGGRFSDRTKRQIDREATAAAGEEGTCEHCGVTLVPEAGSPNSTEYDHQQPRSKGGDNSPGNGRRACRTCNRKFGNSDKPDPRKPIVPGGGEQ